jgi:diphthamide synthase (EF-2-diphthine--ammonia ligase)
MSSPRKAAISWSAGKDCCLALLRARETGLDVRTFVTMCETDGTSPGHRQYGLARWIRVAAQRPAALEALREALR